MTQMENDGGLDQGGSLVKIMRSDGILDSF